MVAGQHALKSRLGHLLKSVYNFATMIKTNRSMALPESQITFATLEDQVRTFIGAGHDGGFETEVGSEGQSDSEEICRACFE